ncbi:MAG: branched-chain amino acid ABC transporter permease [Deltaproteobacteria bacterium]|nr:branched-chain amino acid ABC transporter permease [Deltaproteobacteria bacterium]
MKLRIIHSLIITFWFMLLCFPLVVLKIDYLEKSIRFRWINLFLTGLCVFFISLLWRYFLSRRRKYFLRLPEHFFDLHQSRLIRSKPFLFIFSLVFLSLPLILPNYHTSILITAMIYVVLGLGLNIVVGLAGLLDLGYAAFFAIGGYSFALLNHYFGFGFWASLPIAASLACLGGVLLGIPVLRLRGDYLAIVTLGFGEIIRLILENWEAFTKGPSGIPDLPKPGLFGIQLDFYSSTIYLYYLLILCMLAAILVTKRLSYSKTGRAWVALREDEIAAQSMGIDTTKTKLTAFGIGAFWAGIVGAFFASKNSFVDPSSFTFHESAIILSIVVLGGMGSILGVILATMILVLLPEYLRFLESYRMLIFGAIMVIMMVFRPEGLVKSVRQQYDFKNLK